MSDYVTLIGAEDVRAASGNMKEAAHSMATAALSICSSTEQLSREQDAWVAQLDQVLRRHEEFMNGWLARFEALLSRGIR